MAARKWYSHHDANSLKLINLGAPTAASSDAARIIDVEAAYEAARSRDNHLGSQLANTISDFDTAVRLNRIDQLAPPTGSLSLGGQKIINLADPGAASDAATMGWVQGQLQGLASGQTPKGAVRVAVSTPVNIANPGTSTLDGVGLTAGNLVLLTGQSTGSENGPYVFNGPAAAMTRALNWDSAGEAVVGSYWTVNQGTQAEKFALLTNDSFTLGTDTATFTYVGVAASGVLAVEQDVGNGSATSFTVTHNLGTRAVLVTVYRNASPWDEVDVYVRRPDVNSVVIEPDLVFTPNEFHVVISKA